MDIERLLDKKRKYDDGRDKIDKITLSSYERDFELTYTHNSSAIEGNTLTLMETKVVLEDGLTVAGKTLREIYEVVNHQRAYRYVRKCIQEATILDESIVKNIHAILTENIMLGGIYRNQEVRISGAGHTPPSGEEMFRQVKNFYYDLSWKHARLNPIEFAAWTHAEFVRIHPFIDGNGRTARLIMNYQLLIDGFLPVSIAKENRLDYYNALEAYCAEGNLGEFAELIAELEEKQLDLYISLIKKTLP